MNARDQLTVNRLAAVGLGTVLWVSVLKWLLPAFTLGHALLLGVWIAMGSHHYARTFVDFKRPLKPVILVGLALMAPGWPFLYWRMKSAGIFRRQSPNAD